MPPGNLQPADREYAAWLGDVERRVILPLKWVLLVLCALYWMWSREWMWPGTMPFSLFIIFGGFTVGEQYFFARDRITPRQVRPFIYASFVFDMLFVAGVVLADVYEGQLAGKESTISDFTVLFVLLVLRGFALFRTKEENIFGFLGISVLFLATSWLQLDAIELLNFLPAVGRLGFLWGMMLIIQAFIGLVNRQKEEEFRTRERFIRSASLASLGELAAGVAHEINNPIGIIKTYSDYLQQSTQEDDPLHEDFVTIHSEAERCEEIVRRMLDFSNPNVHGFTSINVEKLADEVIALVFLDRDQDRVEIEKSVSGSIPRVRGDEVQLKQALINVLMNARQLTIDHHEKEQSEESRPKIKLLIGRGTGPRAPVRIAVQDNGPGINQEDAEKAFEPFFTRRSKGTGLGLAITRRIVEAHYGTIRLAPLPEGGTEVTITLPIEGEEEA